jgi:hypothetical protein
MADYVVNFLVEYMTQQLKREGDFFGGVEDQVKSLHRDLRLINIFLESSWGKRNEHPIVKEVVRRIREVACEDEDVIDMFVLKVTEHRRRRLIGRIVHFPTHAMMLRDVGKKIAGIRNEIYNNKERLISELNSLSRDPGSPIWQQTQLGEYMIFECER